MSGAVRVSLFDVYLAALFSLIHIYPLSETTLDNPTALAKYKFNMRESQHCLSVKLIVFVEKQKRYLIETLLASKIL